MPAWSAGYVILYSLYYEHKDAVYSSFAVAAAPRGGSRPLALTNLDESRSAAGPCVTYRRRSLYHAGTKRL